jgi:membrane fusion protein, heavy metal efflux system
VEGPTARTFRHACCIGGSVPTSARQRPPRAIALFALPLLLACGGSTPGPREHEESPYRATDSGRLEVRADLASHIRVEPARGSSIGARVSGFGRVRFASGASYAVRLPFTGLVEEVYVTPGQRVEEGAPLARIRSSEAAQMRAELRRFTATVEAERDAVQRFEGLVEDGAASRRELIEARTRLAEAQAQIQGLRESLSATRTGVRGADVVVLRASAPGEVLIRTIEPGERITPDGEAAFLIGDPSALVVRASFPERDAPMLATDLPCRFTVPALGSQVFEGTITRTVRAIDRQTRSTEIICTPSDIDPRIRTEMVARVEVSVDLDGDGQQDGAVIVPRSAVLLRRDDRVVFVRHGETELERRVVDTGATLGTEIVILSGVGVGEDVVVEGAVLLDGELDRLL